MRATCTRVWAAKTCCSTGAWGACRRARLTAAHESCLRKETCDGREEEEEEEEEKRKDKVMDH